MLANIILVFHLVIAVAIIILVLLQQGKGSDMGAAFGGGSSQTLFGARGSANFLSRTTSVLVTVFFLSSLTLAYFYTHQGESVSVTEPGAPRAGVADIPAIPETPDEESLESDIPVAPSE
jgi:preprotein translocase subunit SecG